MPVRNVWEGIAVGEAGGVRLTVLCSQDDPSRRATHIDTALLQLWFETPDHTIPHQALTFFEQTRGRKLPVRVGMTVGTFCGRAVRLAKNDEDERYFLETVETLRPEGTEEDGDGKFFLRLEEEDVANVVSALRQVAIAIDGRTSSR